MDLKKNTDQAVGNDMPENSAPPQEGTQFGYQQPQERSKPGYYESPSQYNGGPPKHSGVGTLILVYAGLILAVIMAVFLIYTLVIKSHSGTSGSSSGAVYYCIGMLKSVITEI